MFGSLMMLASGVLASSPSSASASSMPLLVGSRRSGKLAMIRPASEMSRVSTATPAVAAYAWMIGRNEYVASSGRLVGVGVDDRVESVTEAPFQGLSARFLDVKIYHSPIRVPPRPVQRWRPARDRG